jgi:hypothetical protein
MNELSSLRNAVGSIAVCLAALGCGESKPLAQVTGRVTLGGASLDQGEVTFFSATGTTGTSAIDAGGTYRLQNPRRQEGVDPGDYTAVVMPSLAQIKKAHGDPMVKVKTNDIPPVYTSSATSPLKFTVVEGPNTIDLVLETKPSPPK